MSNSQESTAAADSLGRVVDELPALIWTSRADGYCTFLNQRWFEYTDLSRDTALGWGWQSVIHPNDREHMLEAWRLTRASGEARDLEARIRRFDGEYRWFLFRSCPVLDASGHVVQWCGMNTDIEDRKRMEEALRLSESLLAGEKKFLEMVAGGSPLTDVLNALCRLVEEVAGGCYCSIVLVDPTGTRLEHGAAPSLPASFITSIVGRPINIESGPCAMAACLNEQVIAADLLSETRWAAYEWCPMALAHGLQACWSTPILSAAGRPLGAFALYFDKPRTPTPQHQSLIDQFTHIASIAIERAQSDEALRQSEAFLAQAQHVSSTGGFSWRAATGELMWSEEVYRIFELDPAFPVTLDLIFTRLHPEDIPSFKDMLIRQNVEPCDFEHEHRLMMPDGSVKYLHVVAHATWDDNNKLLYIAAVRDVTERRLSEEALGKVRADLARVARITTLGALTASIAHEVNQPLSGIITNASTCLRMLAAEPPNVDGARETARRTIRDGHRASDVIARLRDLFAKKDAAIDLVDLNEAVREVIALSRSEFQDSCVVLKQELSEDLPRVAGDRVQLQQVILNLLLNASHAMNEVDDRPRQLVVGTKLDDGGCLLLSVQDAGVGIEPENMNRLFEAFYTTKSNGMGIGLSVSRSIIERHQGRLWAISNDGPGATFSFSIPPASTVHLSADLDAIRPYDLTDKKPSQGTSKI